MSYLFNFCTELSWHRIINDLDIPDFELWKYVDDSTILEAILKGQVSNVQSAVDIFASRAASDKFQLNKTKCKEMRICFSTNGTPNFNPIVINDKQIDVVWHAKILAVNISSDLKWNHHISEVVKKARKRLFCRSQLKRAGLGPNELVQFYWTCIRPITEYACPLFHDGLPVYLSHKLEAVQKRAMRIIFPCFMYDEALVKASLVTLSDRRQALTDKLFKKILDDKDSKLRNLLPPQNSKHYIISEREVSSVRFLRQTGFEVALLFLMHLRLHDVNPFIIFKNLYIYIANFWQIANSLLIVEVHLALKLVNRHSTFWHKLNSKLRIPTGRRQTSWLYTSTAEELSQRLPGTNPASGHSRTWTRDLQILPTQPRRLPQIYIYFFSNLVIM